MTHITPKAQSVDNTRQLTEGEQLRDKEFGTLDTATYSSLEDVDTLVILFRRTESLFDHKMAEDFKARMLQMNSPESSVDAPGSLMENPRLESSNLKKWSLNQSTCSELLRSTYLK